MIKAVISTLLLVKLVFGNDQLILWQDANEGGSSCCISINYNQCYNLYVFNDIMSSWMFISNDFTTENFQVTFFQNAGCNGNFIGYGITGLPPTLGYEVNYIGDNLNDQVSSFYVESHSNGDATGTRTQTSLAIAGNCDVNMCPQPSCCTGGTVCIPQGTAC